jgi:Mn2+/Fe2+ NRAMP family transporter
MLISATVNDISNVFNIVGAISLNSIAFIFPPMFYIFLVKKKNKKRKLHYYVAWFLFCCFIPFGIFSVLINFMK